MIFNTLGRYIAGKFLLNLFTIIAVIAAVIFLVDLVETIRRTSDLQDISFGDCVLLAALRVPFFMQELFSIIILFATLATLWTLTRKQELIVARASGVSVWQFLSPILFWVFAIGVFFATSYTQVSARFLERFEIMQAAHFNKETEMLLTASKDFWLRQTQDKQTVLLVGDRSKTNTSRLFNASLIRYDRQHFVEEYKTAKQVDIADDQVAASDVWIVAAGQPPIHRPTNLFDELSLPLVLPTAIKTSEVTSLWELPDAIKQGLAAGIDVRSHQVRFMKLLFAPLLLCGTVLLAALFSLRPPRQGYAALLLLTGAASALVLHVFNDVVVTLGLSGALPVLLATSALPIMITAVSIFFLIWNEDG